MFKKSFLTGTVALIIASFITVSWAAELLPIKLPPPNLNSGKSVDAISGRQGNCRGIFQHKKTAGRSFF